MRISGLFPALATPVTPSGALDGNTLDRLCDFLLERGASGVCLGGATSEYPRFEAGERLEILRRVARRLPRGTPLVAAIAAKPETDVSALHQHFPESLQWAFGVQMIRD